VSLGLPQTLAGSWQALNPLAEESKAKLDPIVFARGMVDTRLIPGDL
jgi:hypothetical protein